MLACIIKLMLSGCLPFEVKSKRGSDLFKFESNELEGYNNNTYCLTVLSYIYSFYFFL